MTAFNRRLAHRALLARTAASLAILGGLAAAGAANAQDTAQPEPGQSPSVEGVEMAAADAPAGGFDEILVSARRVQESAQRVPIAITNFSGDELRSANISDVTQLQKLVPGVNMCCQPFNNRTNTFVRGIRNGAPTYFADAPVTSEGYSNYFDIASFEVLKGPQGTLFGQASNAGAFVITPNRPGDVLEGHITGTIGNYDRQTLEAAVNLPIVEDRILVRVAGITSKRRGYVQDLKSGAWYGEEDYWIIRPSLLLRITDNLENYTMYEYSDADVNGASRGLWVITDFPTYLLPNGQFDPLRVELIRRQQLLGRYKIQGLSTGCTSPSGPIDGPSTAQITTLDYPQVACPRDIYRQDRVINTTTLDIGDWTVKNIFGYVYDRQLRGPADFDGSPLNILGQYSPRNTRLSEPTTAGGVEPSNGWSNEFQVTGSIDIFDYTAGIFIFRHEYDTGVLYANFNNGPTTASIETGFQDTNGYYAQVNADLEALLPGLTATWGLRRTEDDLGQDVTGVNPATLAPTTMRSLQTSFSSWSYTVGLQYQITPRMMVYLTNSKGYNSGGFQNVAGFEVYQPSSLVNYEGGIKSTFDIGEVPIRFNLSYFYGDFSNVQVANFVPITTSTGTTTYTSVTTNAAQAVVEGFEAEGSILPFTGFELGGWVAYLNNRYTDYPGLTQTGQPVDLSNTPFVWTPDWKFGLNASYTPETPEEVGDITFHGMVNYRARIINQAQPLVPTNPADPFSGLVCTRERTVANGYPAIIADGETIDYDCRRAYTTVDAGITWERVLGLDNITLDFLATNLTKNEVADSAANVRRSFVSHQPALPRMWSLRARFDF